ncbi:MAG TPA: hypothetical protein VMI53_00535 [Opitutaceae bacterium]|nr:hypothetical protein [Opitutaceae bacterium]
MKNYHRFLPRFLGAALLWLLGTAAGAAAATLSTRLIQTGVYVNASAGVQYGYQLWQIGEPGGRTTYAIWVPADASKGPRPAVLITEPYVGLTWSGNPVDLSWASRFNPQQFFYPDVNGPFFDSATSGSIVYSLPATDQIVPQGAVYLGNNVGVLFVFERFYAGGSIADNAKDTTLGLEFLAQQTGVDATHLGIFGSSWGGFEALYGAAGAPAGAVPAAGAALYPPSDFSRFYQYMTYDPFNLIQNPDVLGQRLKFYDPYRRRIIAGTIASLSPLTLNFSSFNLDYLKANLRTDFLVLQDEWDTLVPFAQSIALVATLPNRVQGLWYPHLGPPNYNTLPLGHMPVSPGLDDNSANLFTSAYLLEHLLPAGSPISIPYDSSDFRNFFAYMRSMGDSGADITSLAPRLADLSDPRVTLLDVSSSNPLPPVSGSFWVAYFLSLP